MEHRSRTVARYERGAVRVTAEDPEDRALIANARTVLEHTAELMNSVPTLREVRFAATELARCVRDLLDIVDRDRDPDDD